MIVVVCLPPLALAPALPSSPSQDDITEYCLPKFKLLHQLPLKKKKHVPTVLLFIDGILSLPSFNCYSL
jgi:hypothetical protein